MTQGGGNFYEYPNGVLRNKFGIQDAAALQLAEAAATSFRIAELMQTPPADAFDLDHLKAIHRWIFQDVYSWAGELRTVDISKGTAHFAHYGFLAINAQRLFAQLAQEHHLQGLDPAAFARRAAYFLGEVNALHPFREGNGRTQRFFFWQVA
jgi:cell filamentation protein